jgi:menaquinone-dependent protoporphyrinogen IX oxidase
MAILIVMAAKHGSTLENAQAIGGELGNAGNDFRDWDAIRGWTREIDGALTTSEHAI